MQQSLLDTEVVKSGWADLCSQSIKTRLVAAEAQNVEAMKVGRPYFNLKGFMHVMVQGFIENFPVRG